MDTHASPGVGHNSGDPAPLLVVEGLADRLRMEFAHKARRVRELLEGFDRFKAAMPDGIRNDDEQGKAGDFCRQIGQEMRAIDALRVGVKRPVLEASRIVDGFFAHDLIEPLRVADEQIRDSLGAYAMAKARAARLAAEEERRRAAEELRLAQEAAARKAEEAAARNDTAAMDRAVLEEQAALDAAEAPPVPSVAKASRVRGDLGSVVGIQSRMSYRVVDKVALIRAVASGKVSMDALDVSDAWMKFHIRSTTKNGVCSAAVPGIAFEADQSVVVR